MPTHGACVVCPCCFCKIRCRRNLSLRSCAFFLRRVCVVSPHPSTMADVDDFRIEEEEVDDVEDRQVEAVFASHMPPKPSRAAAVTTPAEEDEGDHNDAPFSAAGTSRRQPRGGVEGARLQSRHIAELVKLLRASLDAPKHSSSAASRPSTAVPAARSTVDFDAAPEATRASKRPVTASTTRRPISAAVTVDSIRERRASSPVAEVERRYHRDIVNMKRETFRAAQLASEALYGTAKGAAAAADTVLDADGAAPNAAAATASGRPPTGTTRSRPSTAAASRPTTAAASRSGSRPASAVASHAASSKVRPFSATSSGTAAPSHIDPVSTLGTAQVIPVRRIDEARMTNRSSSAVPPRPTSFFSAFEYHGIDDFLRHQKQKQHAPYLRAAAAHDQSKSRSSHAKSRLAKDGIAAVQYIHDYVAALGPLTLY